MLEKENKSRLQRPPGGGGPGRSGVSLLEFVITIGVFALLLTTIALIFQGGIQAYKKGEIQTSLKRNVRGVTDLFASEFREAYSVNNNGGRWRMDIRKYFSTGDQQYFVDYWYEPANRRVFRQRTGEPAQVIGEDISFFSSPPFDPIPVSAEMVVESSRYWQTTTLTVRTSTTIARRANLPPASTGRDVTPTSGRANEPLLQRQFSPDSSSRI